MIVAVLNHKGGVGKTTTAVTLAHVGHLRGDPVAVVDFDAPSTGRGSGAAAAYRRARGLGLDAYRLGDDLPEGVEPQRVFVDTPPEATDEGAARALAAADVVLIPTGVGSLDLEVTEAYLRALPTLRGGLDPARVAVIFTATPHYRHDRAGAVGAQWRDEGLTGRCYVVPQLAAYDEADRQGTTVAVGRTVTTRRALRPYETIYEELPELAAGRCDHGDE